MSQRSLALTRAAEEGALDPAAEQKKLITQLTNLVPAESLAAFVALIAATANFSYTTKIWMFWIVLILTPFYIWVNYINAATPDEAATIPWFEMFVGSAAFIFWALSVPQAPFADEVPIFGGTLSPQEGVLITLVGSLVLGAITTGGGTVKKFFAARRAKRGRRGGDGGGRPAGA